MASMPSDLATNRHEGHGRLPSLLMCLVAVGLLETFLFNFPFWESLTFHEASPTSVSYGAGLVDNGDGTLTVVGTDDQVVELEGIDSQVNNLHAVISTDASASLEASVGWSDSAWENEGYHEYPATITASSSDSTYLRLHTSGVTHSLHLSFDLPQGTKVSVSHLGLNEVRPFKVSALRVVCMLLIAGIIFLFRPTSRLWRERICEKDRFGIAMVATVILVVSAVCAVLGLATASDDKPVLVPESGCYWLHGQYTELADSLMQGRVDLDLPVPDWLAELDNPYDPSARDAARGDDGEPYYIDVAYYQGHYYTYFGVVPVVLFSLPLAALTGHVPSVGILQTFWMVLAVVALGLFLYELFKRYAPRSSYALLILSYVSVFLCSGLLYLLMMVHSTYSIPYASALALLFLGLWAWLRAKSALSIGGRSSLVWLVVGSLCVSLTLGCRPTFFLSFFLAIPLFWDEITRGRLFFSWAGSANTLCVLVPLVLVVGAVGAYNMARFGSPMEFGANYNLTGGDMTNRGFQLGRLPLGFFEYLFQPVRIDPQFPYLTVVSAKSIGADYIGYTSSEPYIAGMLALNPLMVVGAVQGWRHRDVLRKSGVLGLCAMLVAISLVCVVVVTEGSGITQRYQSDFGWALGIASVIVVATLMQDADASRTRIYVGVVLACVTICVLLYAMSVFANGMFYSLDTVSPGFYATVRGWFLLM